ncbi:MULTISPECIES: helix-turn-helix domain-containing protein [unclassified Streptomyces]|uniref:helix-turn-helix domain-containing protein n=1 Tax=unclassified Streptomyces TaxID=2593676 RepID=UPI000B868DB6|nr:MULTISPECIES: helix-turn-helix transcriptional regulator [unclassified Streptomyces]MYR93275.1 helix-turn-helix domain-containing protein [Streptomyces sp. SID4937]
MAAGEGTFVYRKELSPEASPQAAYGARLRKLRDARGWTQDDLGDKAGCSGRHISAMETGRKSATLPFSRRADQIFGLVGSPESFEREWREIKHGSLLAGFPEFLGLERRAAEIRLYEVGVVPGLLQTPEYATVLAESVVRRGTITPEQAQERVAVTAQRQEAVFAGRETMVFAMVDESCLLRPVGGPEIMKAQFDHLMDFAELPNTILQVAPFTLGERRPFSLPVTILTLVDRSIVSYAESAQQGYVERETTAVLPLLADYHRLQAVAPSQAASVDIVKQLRKGIT